MFTTPMSRKLRMDFPDMRENDLNVGERPDIERLSLAFDEGS